jgi:hypothetical protein
MTPEMLAIIAIVVSALSLFVPAVACLSPMQPSGKQKGSDAKAAK